MKSLREILENKKINLNIDIEELAHKVFWISFLLLLVIDCIENTSVIYSGAAWLKVMYFFRNMLYLALLVKVGFLSTYQKREMIGVSLALAIGFAGLLGSGDFALFKFAIILIAAKDENSRKLAAVFGMVKTIALALTLLLWRVGLLEALYYQDDKVGYYNTYGFCHRNVLGANMAVICLVWFYLRYRKLKIQDIVVWSAISLVTYKIALSRTSLIMMVLTIFGVFAFQKKEELILGLPKIKKIVPGLFLAMMFVSIVCTIFYTQDQWIWQIIDKIFTKRIRFANYCYQEYGLSFFGQRLPFVSSIEAQNGEIKKLILDNAYMRAILYYGIIPGGVFLFSYFKALSCSIRKKNGVLALMLLIFAVYGLSERYMLDVFYQFPLLIAGRKYFFKTNSRLEQEKKSPLAYADDIVSFVKGKWNEFN